MLVRDTLFASTGNRLDADVPPQVSISGLLVVTPFDTFEQITAVIAPTTIDSRVSSQVVVNSVSFVEAGALDVSSISVTTAEFNISLSTPFEILAFTNATLVDTFDEYLSVISTFAKANYLLGYRSAHETGAYLTSSMDEIIDIAYIADTSKFLDFGRLLIEDEVVSYKSKLSDRFLNLLRGDLSTTAKTHAAGSFIRQYRDEVSIVDVAMDDVKVDIDTIVTVVSLADASANVTLVTQIISDTSIQTLSLEVISDIELAPAITSIPGTTRTVIEADLSILLQVDTTSQLEQLSIIQYGNGSIITTISSVSAELRYVFPAGFFDYFTEHILLADPIATRAGDVYLGASRNEIDTRSFGVVAVSNFDYAQIYETHIRNSDYTLAVLAPSISQINSWSFIDDGAADVSSPTFGELAVISEGFTIQDITESGLRGYSPSSGAFYNIGYPSIQNPVTTSQFTGSIGSTITVTSTAYFPTSGYLFHESRGVIKYTGKTATSFTGCTVYSGLTTITTGNIIVPYSV